MFLTRPLIVLIDDDKDDNEILSASLEALNIDTQSFESGEKALLFLDSSHKLPAMPSLVILDYNMPAMNGMEILFKLKANKKTSHIPVILYSTSLSTICQKKLIDNGAYACYIKASSFLELKLHVKAFSMLAGHFSRSNEQKKYQYNTGLENSA